jgi:hypothetical protein
MCCWISRSSSWRSSGVSISGLLRLGAGQSDDLGGQAPLAGLQDAAVRLGESGEIDAGEFLKGALGLVEARLEVARRGTEGRHGAGARGRHGAAGIAHERLAGGRVAGRPPGSEKGLGLPRAQTVAREGVGQARLLAARQRRHAEGRGGREVAGIDLRGHIGREATAEGQAPVHPAPAAAEQLGDLGGREMIGVGQRADHPGLVHGAEGAPRGVGLEQPGLGHDADGVFDHDGHMRMAVVGPVGEALEAVEHFVGAVPGRGHAEGQRGERARGIGARPAQRRQGRGELREGEVEDEGHDGGPSTGRSW